MGRVALTIFSDLDSIGHHCAFYVLSVPGLRRRLTSVPATTHHYYEVLSQARACQDLTVHRSSLQLDSIGYNGGSLFFASNSNSPFAGKAFSTLMGHEKGILTSHRKSENLPMPSFVPLARSH